MAEGEKEKHHGKVRHHIKSASKNYWAIAAFILTILLIIILIWPSGIGKATAGQKVVAFITENGGEATLISVSETSGLYEVTVLLQGQEMPVYLTKNGENLIPPTGLISLTAPEITDTPQTAEEIPQSDKPVVELYLMSFCPYGNRAENTMQPVYDLLKDYIDFKVHYIVSVSGTSVSSLHGQPEVDQNIREACVLKNNGLDKWWTFTVYVNDNCGSDGSCWQTAASTAGVSTSSISSCVSSQGLTLMNEEAAATDLARASGSPTMLINNVQSNAVYSYENPEAYKQAICSAFTTAPEACEQVLSGSGSTAQGGSC